MSIVVITPPTSKRLTTVEHVRGDLGLAENVPPTAQIERWIDQASSRAASFCRRTFGRELVRQRFELCHGRIDEAQSGLLLDRGPVVSISSVTVDGEAQDASTYESDGRFLYRLDGMDRRCWYGRVVLVEYMAGWVLPGDSDASQPPAGAELLPADVERAVIQLVGAALSAGSRDMMVKSERVEGVGQTDWYVQGANASLPHPEAEAPLSEYRKLLFT
ncbi:hypothetical protein [Methylobacterium gnaphalii]|uniref:Uncharacterized protein n=1 Tax=Methylobacterium gnaphalii TaxID=1010610 RepID=A0A512JS73_9HYPH|nr:hypothetical protein [Methylobacterium gnaphalii]GEP12808.1 hypothetical protein MGN01_46530 [Methylobacterium gnaphalii]GJD71515.1 hypothetical protein MMMDOFMJ_4476 [Methylobacterium gnaphalii]GLS50633.1 hypothetical protein GCM10007885_34860 [Methylobacterium gnaphalii]